jgi:nucleoid-associated protein YgaU
MGTTTASGSLEKLRIDAYENPSCTGAIAQTYSLMFNPSTYDENWDVRWKLDQPQGTSGVQAEFDHIAPQAFAFDFYVDGTGAADGKPIDVYSNITQFLKLIATYDGKVHRPRYCQLTWGSMTFCGVLSSAKISYLMFKPDGDPLRAKITAKFISSTTDTARLASENNSSPDMTHTWKVSRGDRLPTISNQIYGSPNYYLQLAAYNGLTEFRTLTPGTTLQVPRLETLLALVPPPA